MKKNDIEKNSVLDKIAFRQFLKIFKQIKLPWLLMILSILSDMVMYVFSSFSKQITGNVVDSKGSISNGLLVSYAITMTLVAVMTVISYILRGVYSEKINLRLRQKLWKKMMYIPQKSFDIDKGETLVSRVTKDCDFASTLFTTIFSAFTLIFGFVMYLVQMYLTNVTMASFILLLLPVSALVGWGYGKLQYWIGQRTQATLSDSTTYLIERTKNFNLIKASNTQKLEEAVGRKQFEEQYKIDIKTGWAQGLYSVITNGLNIFSMAITFIFGGMLVSKHVLTTGNIVTFYIFSTALASMFSNFISYFGSIKLTIGSLARITKIFEIESEELDKGLDMDVPDADIVFKNVDFAYSDKESTLKDFTCIIPKNKTTAVIGANGSGKTTMFKLLERFYNTDQGKILFGNTNINDFKVSSWRKAFALVAQDHPLMEGTIRGNIVYGCEREVTEEELKEVAKMANLTELVESLPDGFDSYVAPEGRNFSGGQRQCVAIARAIMHNPDYLLLDEATSSLDAKCERTVVDGFGKFMKNRTVVIIAHNLSAIRNADNVIVLKDGKIAASGSPQDILKTSIDYRDFVMKHKNPAEGMA